MIFRNIPVECGAPGDLQQSAGVRLHISRAREGGLDFRSGRGWFAATGSDEFKRRRSSRLQQNTVFLYRNQ